MMKSKTNMRSCARREATRIQTRFMKVVIVCMLFYSITPLSAATPWLHVEGNQIKDPAGNQVVLRGVAVEDLGCVAVWRDGVENQIDRLTDMNDTQGAYTGWYTKVVRLAVYPSDQGGYNGPWYFDSNPDYYYDNLLRPAVDYCKSKGLYVIIDWHYIANTGDHVASTSAFWEYIAPRFAGDSHVIFELFNEPTDSSWPVVKANMQTWIDIVRTYAPNNLILVGGPNWCQVLRPQITDPVVGNNIVYVAHLYPAHWYGGVWQIDVDGIADCAAVHPVMMTEWGFISPGSTLFNGTISSYGQPLMDFLELHKIGNTAWCADYDWYPPMFYSNWTLRCGDGEMGCFVKDTLYLRRNDDQPSPVNLYYVDADANGTNDGSSWENAFKYLLDALAAVPGGSEIRVAEGVYKPDEDTAHPDGSGDRAAAFQLKTDVAIKGGYAGYGAANPNERDLNTYETILSGDLNGDDGPSFTNNGENSYHVVTASNINAMAVLDGFTVTAGNANGGGTADFGGGIYNENSSPTVEGCIFSGNSAEYGGGMDNFYDSSPTLTNCTFSNNFAGAGGGMDNFYNSSPTVTNCTFTGNSADAGGGMDNFYNSSPTVTNCTFTGNLADNGGGMDNFYDSSPTLTNCTFSNNFASGGGGIYNENSSPTVTNCVLWADLPSEIDGDSPIVTYSDVQGSWPGTGNINADPCFVEPGYWADANDPNIIVEPNDPNAIWLNGDYHLLPGSPCIDAGDNTAVPAGITTDLDGNRRIRGPAVDIGAYESPAVLFVDVDAVGANNGSSWKDAYNYLQDALSTEWRVDEIRVAEGVYKPDEDTAHPNGSGDRAAAFQLKTGVVIKGGYAGYGEPDPDARDIELYETILSGDLNGDDGPSFTNNGENSYHAVTGSGTGPTAVLDGFTITAGDANGSTEENIYGSGMFNYNSSSTLTNCTFIGNSAEYGGGMFNYNSSLTLTNCTFSDNRAAYYGGGMFNYQSSPTLTNCTFSDNWAAYYGGGMENYPSSSPTLTNCTFSGNSADYGGGMDNYYNSSSTVTNCTFSGNSANTGGGMSNYESNPTLSNCILWDNTAPTGPQIYNEGTSSPTITYCDVQAGYAGAGNIDADPCFVSPGHWDANSIWVEGDYPLLRTSPCIDAGDNDSVPPDIPDLDGDGNTTEPIPFDLAGNPRIWDANCDGQTIVDMGAFEFYLVGDIIEDCRVDQFDLDLLTDNWLRTGCTAINNWCDRTDINKDGEVTLADYAEMANHWLECTSVECG
jgi:hypothetical protein